MMNKQIVKLISEADAYAWSVTNTKYDPEQGEVNYLWEDAFRLKFAELIVRECADLCLDMKYVDPQPHHYAVMLKEHFGVNK